nr:MAG TPA: hypothetical protein [Caudoviricetes sp.]
MYYMQKTNILRVFFVVSGIIRMFMVFNIYNSPLRAELAFYA